MDKVTDEIPRLYYSIGKTAKECGVATSCIRFWEEELGMDIFRTRGGIRKYTREQVAKLKVIASNREEGYTLKWLKSHKEERDLKEMDIQNSICE